MYNGTLSSTDSTLTNGSLQRGVQQVGDTLHSTIDKVAEPVRGAVDRASTTAHQTVDKVTTSVHAAAEKVDTQARRLTAAPNRAVDYSRDYVRGRPLQAVAMALAAGWLIGRLGAYR